MKFHHKNPLSASEKKPKQIELLYSLTEYLTERGWNDYNKHPSVLIGYIFAIKHLWEDQKPNGYGYMQEKLGEAISSFNMMMRCSDDEDRREWEHHHNMMLQSFSKIDSAISMFRNQRKAWESEEE